MKKLVPEPSENINRMIKGKKEEKAMNRPS